MPVYSYAQLETLWINAGGPKALAPVAAAIGEAESGGNSDAVNPNDNNGTQSSYGIWQISNGTHAPPSPNWASPAVNAQLAVGKWKGAGQSFKPWGTFDSGAYKAFLSPGTTPDPSVPGSATALAAQTAAAGGADCLIGWNNVNVPIIPGVYSQTVIPAGCLLTKSNARAFIGVGLMITGALITLPGLVMVTLGVSWLRTAAGWTNQIPVAGQTTKVIVERGQATVRKAPWYERANNPENLNPLFPG